MSPRYVVLFVVLLAGCPFLMPRRRPANTTAFPDQTIYVRRWHDDSLRVTCWVTHEGYSGGISCLPDSVLGLSSLSEEP